MSRQFLNCPRSRTSHRKVRTERMPQDVDADVEQVSATSRPCNEPLDEPLSEWAAVRCTQHSNASEVPMFAQSSAQPHGQRHVTHPSTLRARRLPFPDRPLDAKLSFYEIHVRPFERQTTFAGRFNCRRARCRKDALRAVLRSFRGRVKLLLLTPPIQCRARRGRGAPEDR